MQRSFEHDPAQTPYSGLVSFAHTVRRNAWLVALVTVGAVAVAALITSHQRSIYRASQQLVICQGSPRPQDSCVFVSGNDTQAWAQTMRQVMKSDPVARSVIRDLRLQGTSPQKLLSDLNVTFAPDSAVLNLTYDSPSKRAAVVTLNAVTDEFTSLINRTFNPSGQGAKANPVLPPVTLRAIGPAHLDPGRVSPHPKTTLLFAALLGLFVGGILSFLRERLANVIRTRAQAEQSFAAPVVGSVPKSIQRLRSAAAMNGRPGDPRLVDSIRLLAMNVQQGQKPAAAQTIVVTCADSEPAKANLVAHLGVSLAQTGEDVLCIEADLRDPQLQRYLPLDPTRAGVAELMAEDIDPVEAFQELPLVETALNGGAGVQHGTAADVEASAADRSPASKKGLPIEVSPWHPTTPRGRLRAIGAGRETDSPALATPDRISELFISLEQEAAYVIFNAPPILKSPEALMLAQLASGVLVVATEGRTTTDDAARAGETLERLRVAKPGIVLVGSG
jgi:capsular polysaccharide biosynthesis protein